MSVIVDLTSTQLTISIFAKISRLAPPSQIAIFALLASCGQRESAAATVGDAMVAEKAEPQSAAEGAKNEHPLKDTSPQPASGVCPENMLLVEGNYCPDAAYHCKRWLDPPGPFHMFRCAEYAPSTCPSKARVAMRFCIDKYEYTAKGESLPAVKHSWTTAKETCETDGKRLCLESEWQFACEGEEMRPYPYGFKRDAKACNIDRSPLGRPNGGLTDYREPRDARPQCLSPFGVVNMSGNVEEWATLDKPSNPHDRSSMKGAWWLPGRNTCRAATTGHGETYAGKQVGIRCCKDAIR